MTPATLTPREIGARRRSTRGGPCDEPPRLWNEGAVEIEDRTGAGVTAAVTAEPAVPPSPPPPELGATLADRVADAWGALVATDQPACLLCGSEMLPRWSAGAGVVGGRCGDCGTVLE